MTPDALVLGPLVLEWGRLAFLIGVMVFLRVLSTKDQKLERIGTVAVILGVLAARLGFVFEQRKAFEAGNVLEVFDLRSGGFSWPWASLALVVFVWLRTPAQLSKLASAAGIAVVTAALQRIAQRLTQFVNLWRPTGVATDSGFQRSESAKRVNVFENRCKVLEWLAAN